MIRKLLLGAVAAVISAGAPNAAEIQLEGKNADGIWVVSVRGDLIERDIERFSDVTKDIEQAIISFSSDGGSIAAGIEIGTRVRLRGYKTIVGNDKECYSACALAWLGGTTRYVGSGAKIGFHAAYLESEGRFQETGLGNALVGGYAANLGLRAPAIMFLTSAPPEDINLLTSTIAPRIGIPAEFGDFSERKDVVNQLFTEKNGEKGVENKQIRSMSLEEAYTGLTPDELRDRAEQGNVESQYSIADFALFREEFDKSIYWLKKAAEQNHAKSQFKIGIIYSQGLGVAEDSAEAARWYRKAAEQGYKKAQYMLGFSFAEGDGVPHDQAEAARWYLKAAEQGHAPAQFELGYMYGQGLGVRQDDRKSKSWVRKAAEQEHAEARFMLGVIYTNGLGTKQDYVEGARWWRKSAEQGFVIAQFHMGVAYANGQGVPQNYAEAARWYHAASAKAYTPAQLNLGALYAIGQGVNQNYIFAHMWWNLAASAGENDARKNRDRLAELMAPNQIAEAQRLASLFTAVRTEPEAAPESHPN